LIRKKIAFLTGTRADYGKIKPLISSLGSNFEVLIIATGMHLMESYGNTVKQLKNDRLARIETFKNQDLDSTMQEVLANTILGLSQLLEKENIDLLVLHGDRVESMAGAITAALMNIRVAHIEGGEISGTVDNLMRHSISKLAQHHFVTNKRAANILSKIGESNSQIYEIGSPDLDIIESSLIPQISEVKSHYGIIFENYGILLFHPVTTELHFLESQMDEICEAVLASDLQWVIIQPNNDTGSNIVREKLKKLSNPSVFKHIQSMRFEYFIGLMQNSSLILGNSSAGIMEAPHLGIPSVNIGTRQRNRFNEEEIPSIVNTIANRKSILNAIEFTKLMKIIPTKKFGDGNASKRFNSILQKDDFWSYPLEKLDSNHL
jgi:UDP-N-acetylglucosamine 2-epimerase (hydrolysing)